MRVKMHFLKFPNNLGDVRHEIVEMFHQDVVIMKEWYQGYWDYHMMAD